MSNTVRFVAALAVLAGLAALFAAPMARSQPQITPSFLVLGTSQSGTSSMAWFHDPSRAPVMACQASPLGNGTPAVACAIAKMP